VALSEWIWRETATRFLPHSHKPLTEKETKKGRDAGFFGRSKKQAPIPIVHFTTLYKKRDLTMGSPRFTIAGHTQKKKNGTFFRLHRPYSSAIPGDCGKPANGIWKISRFFPSH